MAEISTTNPLPPGWDCKYDAKTSRYYYINHLTKTTTWEDPRLRHRQIHGTPTHIPSLPVEHIPLQHGSPEFRRNYVYPSQTCPQPAFQMPKNIFSQDLSNIARMSPAATGRNFASLTKNLVPATSGNPLMSQVVSRMQETNLAAAAPAATDTEQAIAKISTMFPTVSETHIQLLMKKYYNREAVVISALQVEKYPITTPGPYTTPPPNRNLPPGTTHIPLHGTPPLSGLRYSIAGVGIRGTATGARMSNGATSRTGSPVTRPGSAVASPKPHPSPKMKLRYMKNVFPQVEETLLLEVLGNNDNNVQKASEALKEMGFEKHEIKLTKAKNSKSDATTSSKTAAEEANAAARAPPPARMLSLEDKNKMKSQLQEKYKDIPSRVIVIALESVDYNKSRASQVLDIMVQKDSNSSNSSKASSESPETAEASSSSKQDKNKIEPASSSTAILRKSKSPLITPSPSVHVLHCDNLDSKVRRPKETHSFIRGEPNSEDNGSGSGNEDRDGYKSTYLRKVSGPNSNLSKGCDEKMLLLDYVCWNGPDSSLREGRSPSLAVGPNASLLSQRLYQPHGPSATNRKGPAIGLAKGSIYSQLKSGATGGAAGESRGK